MKLNLQTKYFINGVVLIVLGVFCITLLPILIKSKTNLVIANYVYYEIEFFMLSAASIFFLFCPKYFKGQIIAILGGILYYFSFVNYFFFF